MIGSDLPPGTFVPADDNIIAPIGYGTPWLAVGVLAALLGLALLAWCLHPRPADLEPRRRPTNVAAIKARYISTVNELEREFAAHQIDERQLHHRLSRTVREFAADLGEPGAVAMTASVLHDVGLPTVATVVAGYEQPQFKERHRSEPATSCDRARALIARW